MNTGMNTTASVMSLPWSLDASRIMKLNGMLYPTRDGRIPEQKKVHAPPSGILRFKSALIVKSMHTYDTMKNTKCGENITQ
jgi:hypothetical protein